MSRIYLSPPHVTGAERELLLDAFDSNWIAPLGPHVDAFEEEFARAVQVPYAAALSSGTAALHLGLMLLGVGPGDEVLTSTLTFAATVNPIVYRGATPVFIDSDRDTWTMDPALLEQELKACAERGRLPKAVVVVDLYGQCADYDRIVAACDAYGVPILEDAAEALGSTYRGVPAGNFGSIAAFSFNGNKIITTSGGGMLVSRRSDWVERARFLSTQARDQAPHYQHSEIGYNYRMSNLLAAVGRGQLRTIRERVERRRAHNAAYREAFAGIDGISFMPEADYGHSNHWLTTVLIDSKSLGATPEEIRLKLDAGGIETRPVWKPMHLQPAFAQYRTRGGGISAGLFERGLCLPSGSSMTDDARQRVVDHLLDAVGRSAVGTTRMPVAQSLEVPHIAPDQTRARFVPAKRWILRRGRAISVAAQIGLVAAANAAAFILRFDGRVPDWAWTAFWRMLPALMILRVSAFAHFRLFAGVWQYSSVYDVKAIVTAVAASSAAFAALVYTPLGINGYPRSIYIIDALLLIFGLTGIRLARRIYSEMKRPAVTRRVLIVGAGSAGELVVRDMTRNRDLGLLPVGFVDDDVSKHGRSIHGVSVLGGRMELPKIMAAHRPDEVVVALPSGAASTLRSILRDLEPYKVEIRTLPSLRELLGRGALASQIREMRMEDLLRRAPVGTDPGAVRRAVEGKSILITGAGSAVAAAIVEQIASLGPSKIVLLDTSESRLRPVAAALEAQRLEVISLIGDIADHRTVYGVFSAHKPAVVFHAASHHNVRMMEANPAEAVRTNITGLRLVSEAAMASGADSMVLLSTLKAVNPRGIAGLTARFGELLMQAYGPEWSPRFTAARLGSVLGRPGSVVPVLRDQLRRGAPLTVSDPEVRRYFMLPSEAAQLALYAMTRQDSGAVFVLDMGEQVKVADLARDVARMEGGRPEEAVPIRFTGLRAHDRLYDELASPDEMLKPTGVARVMQVHAQAPALSDLLRLSDALSRAASAGDGQAIASLLQTLALSTDAGPAVLGATVAQDSPVSERALTESRAEGSTPAGQECPACRHLQAHRSKTRSVAERLKKEFTAERLFRCDGCGWRGWMLPLDRPEAVSLSTGSVDLGALDDLVPMPNGRSGITPERSLDD